MQYFERLYLVDWNAAMCSLLGVFIAVSIHSLDLNILNALFVNIRCGNILYHLIVCFCPVSLSLTSMSCFLAGRSRNFMLHWRLRVHHVRWLRPLLWRHIHSNSCRGNHSSGNAALYHRLDRVLRYDTRELLRPCDGECGQTIWSKLRLYIAQLWRFHPLSFSVCRNPAAGVCHRVRGGGARLHIQGKGKYTDSWHRVRILQQWSGTIRVQTSICGF